MAAPGVSAADMLPQLESARKLALADAQVYTQVIPGILPIIGPAAPLEVRRWGADFLAEGFASPSLAANQKEQMVSNVLPTLKGMLENPAEDMAVVKSAIQASASIYSLVFRRVYVNSSTRADYVSIPYISSCNACGRADRFADVLLQYIPSRSSVIMAGYECHQNEHPSTHGYLPSGRACSVYKIRSEGGAGTDTRCHSRSSSESLPKDWCPHGWTDSMQRPDRNEISIALVPRNHPLLPVPHIEAETSGLLDRLLSVLQEQSG